MTYLAKNNSELYRERVIDFVDILTYLNEHTERFSSANIPIYKAIISWSWVDEVERDDDGLL